MTYVIYNADHHRLPNGAFGLAKCRHEKCNPTPYCKSFKSNLLTFGNKISGIIKPCTVVCLLFYEILSYVEKNEKIEAFSQGLKILELYLR